MRERLDATAPFNTGFTGQPGEMPITGTAEFRGFAGLAVATAAPLTLTGRATLNADFGARTLTGSATGFQGVQGGTTTDYAGTINFVDGTIGRHGSVAASVPNDLRFDYEGQLSNNGTTLAVDDQAAGKFRGTPIRGLLVEAAPTTASVNGASTPAAFGLIAEIAEP